MTDIWRSKCGAIELRCGRWQEVLADIKECQAVICDPPYSPRVHSGFLSGNDAWNAPAATGIDGYSSLKDSDVSDFVSRLCPITKKWIVIFSDHSSRILWEAAISGAGLLVFAPVGWVKPNKPRFQGDGPSCSVEWITVARHRRRLAAEDFGSRPGHYLAEHHSLNRDKKVGDTQPIVGVKPLAGMIRLIRDYSLPGDLVLDPYAGSATTLLAAAIEGRRAIGAECDPKTFSLAVKRLEKGWTTKLQFDCPPEMTQNKLL